MNVTDEFTSNPSEFLEKYVVQVADASQMGSKRVDTKEFEFFLLGESKVVALRSAKSGSKVKAYWLPWKTGEHTVLDLGGDADYFFTSQMTGCRFTVLSKDAKSPKVTHMAGTMSKTKRNTEEGNLVKQMGGSDVVRSRRLSVSDVKSHGYAGQLSGGAAKDSSSAFVYGVRDTGSKEWSFAAQIVKAAMVESFNPKIQGTPTIMKPFVF